MKKPILSAVIASFLVSGPLPLLALDPIRMTSDGITLSMDPVAGRYSFVKAGKQIVGADATAGILLAGSPVSFPARTHCSGSTCVLEGTSAAGGKLRLTVTLTPHQAELVAEPTHEGDEVRFITAGAAPAYGLADQAVDQKIHSTLANKQFNTDVTGFADDTFLSGQGISRLVSNFIIYPKQQFAELLIDPSMKIVHTSEQQIVQGVVHSGAQVRVFYFFGDPHAIYAAYLHARNEAGYKVMMPKYEAFGVGWEAFGALGWNTNAKTVRDSVDHYLADGYPLRWAVIGSGFWPAAPEMHETTSFGFWNHDKYPDPRGLIQHFRDEKLIVMLGLRICFITNGPFAEEGMEKGFFLKKDGKAEVFPVAGWPELPHYILDAQNKAAVDWYMSLVKKWQGYGISGWKEDFYGYGGHSLRDDKIDPTNDRLMEQHQLVIERNGYLSSNGDLHRINDFNYNQDQDRGPVNALAFAYSGFPLVYPDIVGGTFGENHFQSTRTPRMETYMMRNAQWAALHSSMGMGEPPWTFKPEVAKVMLASAKLHARIAPYLFSNARRFVHDGYPWTMTPLPIAFPGDAATYGRENATDRAYEWMIGDAMLATPLYGNDYETATTRDIYLPAGEWMDYDTGRLYTGRQTLKGFALPVGKTPLFIGGSGVTLEEIDGVVKACVYPVARQATVELTLPESDRPFTVTVHGLATGAVWSGIQVADRGGRTIPVSVCGHGFAFIPASGESYTVTAVR
jgi:alpha-glucosidase (family GH31 glycosyl hydrolase)